MIDSSNYLELSWVALAFRMAMFARLISKHSHPKVARRCRVGVVRKVLLLAAAPLQLFVVLPVDERIHEIE